MSTIDEIKSELQGIKSFVTEKVTEGAKPLAEENQRLAKALTDVQAKVGELQREKIAGMNDDGRVIVREGRLAGLDMLDLRILEKVADARTQHGAHDHTELLREISKQRANVVSGITPDKILKWHERSVKVRGSTFVAPPPSIMADFDAHMGSWSRDMIRQKAAMDSATAATGGNLVPTFEAGELFLAVNLDTLILPALQQTAMPTNPFTLPSQFGDTNWYPSDENVQVLTTGLGTPKTTLTAYGLKTGVPFSDELEEDSIVAFVPELRRALTRNAAEVIDDVLLNADTTTSNGINSDGTVISKTTAAKAQWLLGFDGITHLALVDNSANQSVDNAGAVSTAAYNKALTKLGKNGIARRPGEVIYVADVNTAIASMGISSFMTLDVAGTRATLSAGELLNVFGKPLIQSAQFKLADTDGKVTASGNATNTGRILCFNTTQWRVGFRRQITLETAREAGKGQTTLYVSFRIALTEQSGTRSTATHTSLTYDITGV